MRHWAHDFSRYTANDHQRVIGLLRAKLKGKRLTDLERENIEEAIAEHVDERTKKRKLEKVG